MKISWYYFAGIAGLSAAASLMTLPMQSIYEVLISIAFGKIPGSSFPIYWGAWATHYIIVVAMVTAIATKRRPMALIK